MRVLRRPVLGLVLAIGALAGVMAAPAASADPGAPAFAITLHTRTDVSHFETFRYDTASAINVPADAAKRIDAAVQAIVTRNVKEAASNGRFPCYGGPKRCGVLDSTLTQLPCVGGYLCIQQLADQYWPGAMTTNKAVDALVFDPNTGSVVTIAQEMGTAPTAAFVSTVRAAVKKYQVANGFYDPIFMKLVKLSTMKHWAPLPDGIHVWFDKYVAGPGAAGIVEVTVPYPSGAVIRP